MRPAVAIALVLWALCAAAASASEPGTQTSPWSASAREGTWWRVAFVTHPTGESWEATLVLTHYDDGWALGFEGTGEALAAALGFRSLPLGRLGPSLEHDGHEDFRPLRFPAAVGDRWQTEFLSYALQATVTSVEDATVRVDYDFQWGALGYGHALYEPAIGFFREFAIDGWTSFRTLDWGQGHSCDVGVPWDVDHLFTEGSYPADDRSRPLGPVAATRDVTDGHPASALFLIAGGIDGPNAVSVTAPDGQRFEAGALAGALFDGLYEVGADPTGTWTVATTSHERSLAYAQLMGFTWREGEDGCGPTGTAHAAGPSLVPNETNRLEPLGAITAFGASMIAFWALKPRLPRLLVPLYARIPRERVLENRNRSQIVDLVRARPGMTTQELRRELGLGWGATTHHVTVLEAHGLLRSVRWGRNRDWYVAGTMSPQACLRTSALKRSRARALYELIASRPGVAQQQLADALGLHHSTIGFHIRKLVRAGLIEVERRTNAVRLYLAGRRP